MMSIDEMNAIREELGLSYQKICMESGVPIGTIQKVLGGVTKNPRMETMKKLEDTLGRMKRGYDYFHQNGSGSSTFMVRESAAVYHVNPSAPSASGSPGHEQPVRKEPHLVTAAEREALPDDRRTELIDGVLYDMASPSMPHQDITRMIGMQIDDCIHQHHSECHVFIAPADVCLDCDEYTMVQPDVFIVCDRKQITRKNIQGAPAFILEVLSPSTKAKDQKIKLWKYMNAGVREYWMIDPDKRKVVVFDMTKANGNQGENDLSGTEGTETDYQKEQDKPQNGEQNLESDPYNISIYGFSDRIPLAISKGKCMIDMNPIRETLDDLYPEDPE